MRVIEAQALTRATPALRPTEVHVRSGAAERPWVFVCVWALAWAAVGLGVGLIISFAQGDVGLFAPGRDTWPIVQLSVLFAEVVGVTALVSSRMIFPYFARLPYVPQLLLQVATLSGGALFGSVLALAVRPLFALHQARLIIVMVLVNATLALAVGIVVHTYESMKAQLERTFIALRAKEAMDREMDIAREVQEQLFPKSVPRINGIEVAGVCLPAAGVGGDYYDYISLSDDRLGLVVADVSGKGISAALLMASLQASVRNVMGPDSTPCDVNAQLNQILYRSTTASRYATLFVGLFDAPTRTFRYSNAGHNPALIIGRNGAQKLCEGGLPLGILEGVHYTEGSKVLEPGDLLLMYTDGAVEATDHTGCEFSLDRLAEFMQKQRHAVELPGLLQEALAMLRDWTKGSPQQDDITLVVARPVVHGA